MITLLSVATSIEAIAEINVSQMLDRAELLPRLARCACRAPSGTF
jgi:hypothetical protein